MANKNERHIKAYAKELRRIADDVEFIAENDKIDSTAVVGVILHRQNWGLANATSILETILEDRENV